VIEKTSYFLNVNADDCVVPMEENPTSFINTIKESIPVTNRERLI
jgi:hypothetical protein